MRFLSLLPMLLYGEVPTTPAPAEPPEEKMIPESEWKRMLEAERKRVQTETMTKAKAELETEYSSKIIPEETLKELGLKSHDELKVFIKEARDAMEAKDKKGKGGEDTSEEIQALEARFQAEIEQREKEIENLAKEKVVFQAEIAQERIDNSLKHELEKHRAMSPDLLVLKLRDSVKLNAQRQPIVVNEAGELRVKTVEYIQDGVKRFKTEDMTIADVVEEFLNQEENQHFLPASPREGSGGRNTQPLDRTASRDINYRSKMEDTVNQGQGVTADFLKAWQEKYHNRRVA